MPGNEVEVHARVEYLRRGDASLWGALYVPKGQGPFPAVVAFHGGGWRIASTDTYQYFAPWLASQGYVVFTPTYTMAKAGAPSYPAAIQDARAAVQFLRGRAADYKVAVDRIATLGESAGGCLAMMVALAGEEPQFRGDVGEFANLPATVKAAVSAYGVHDLAAQWRWDQLARAGEHITEPFLGKSLLDDRRIYFEASPISYATIRPKAPAILLAWGTEDDVCEPKTQSVPFFEALKQARYQVRTVIVQSAPHYWMAEPLDETGSFPAFFAPRLLRFLRQRL